MKKTDVCTNLACFASAKDPTRSETAWRSACGDKTAVVCFASSPPAAALLLFSGTEKPETWPSTSQRPMIAVAVDAGVSLMALHNE